MDDVENIDVNNEAVVDDSPATPSVEEPKAIEEVNTPTEEVESTEETEPVEEVTETVESEGEPSKKGLNNRVRELNSRTKQAEAKAESLAERLEKLTGSVEPKEQSFTPQVQPGSEVTPDQYKQDVMRTADSLVQLRMKQQTALDKITSESNQVIRDYPQLDPDNEAFDKELSDTVTDAVEAHVRAKPYTASVKKFADRLMKPYNRSVDNKVGQAKETLAKQVSETALRPTQVKAKDKTADEKSIKELEAELGFVNT